MYFKLSISLRNAPPPNPVEACSVQLHYFRREIIFFCVTICFSVVQPIDCPCYVQFCGHPLLVFGLIFLSILANFSSNFVLMLVQVHSSDQFHSLMQLPQPLGPIAFCSQVVFILVLRWLFRLSFSIYYFILFIFPPISQFICT